MLYALLTMAYLYFYTELVVDVLGKMLSTIDAAVLTTRTTETEHQGGEPTLNITTHMGIGQFINAVEESKYLTVVLEETDDGFVKSGELLIGLIASRIVGATAVEHITSAISAGILGNTFAIGEAEHFNH